MKVLIAHNRYRSASPSGENKAVDAEIALLTAAGIDVIPLIEESDSIGSSLSGKLRAAPGPVYSWRGTRRFREAISRYTPDVVHIHNVFPLLSPWIIRVAAHARVPVVQTVHNYRHSCVNGLHFRDGHACVECLNSKLQLPGSIHGCYRGSRAQTLPMTVGQNVHKVTWRRGVATFLALTPFMRQQLIAAGIPERSIVVRPSWVPDSAAQRTQPGSSVLFLGRLEESKGVLLLLDSWKRTQRHRARRKLVIAGDGPLAPVVAALAETDSSIHFLGRISSERAIGLLDDCAYVVIPSIWFEGYPLVMAEARSRGRATLAFEGGSPASVLQAGGGWAIPPSGDSLLRALNEISAPAAVDEGDKARRLYECENSPEVALASLLDVYERVRLAPGRAFEIGSDRDVEDLPR